MCSNSFSRGMALIEAIVFMMIIGVAAGAMLSVFGNSNRASGEVLLNKQAMMIAESLLAEVRSVGFTYCDPDLPGFGAYANSAACPAGTSEALVPGGAEVGEGRLGPARFDNVSDYNGFAMGPGITALNGIAIAGLAAFSATITVAPIVAAGNWNGVAGTEMALITVSVRHPALTPPIVLQGVRARYLTATNAGRLP